jgi:hypothetical protein
VCQDAKKEILVYNVQAGTRMGARSAGLEQDTRRIKFGTK